MKRNLFFIPTLIIIVIIFSLNPMAKEILESSSEDGIAIAGDGTSPESPLAIELNQVYSTWDDTYYSFNVIINTTYYLYYDHQMFWTPILFDDPSFTPAHLLGEAYTVSGSDPFQRYLIFSPNRTGTYYLQMVEEIDLSTVNFAVLTPEVYTINTSRLIIIAEQITPVKLLGINLESGNYSCSMEVLYAQISLGLNYVIFPEAYDILPKTVISYITAGYFLFIIEESCTFQLISYPRINTTTVIVPPIDPPHDNTTDTESNSLFGEITPIMAVGAMIGVLFVCKMKKKK